MSGQNNISNRLLDQTLTRQVRELASFTNNIVVSYHAEDQMYERNINYQSVLEILRTGEITFERMDKRGNSVVRATKTMIGLRDASVVTAVIDQKNKLILITVMWEDPK